MSSGQSTPTSSARRAATVRLPAGRSAVAPGPPLLTASSSSSADCWRQYGGRWGRHSCLPCCEGRQECLPHLFLLLVRGQAALRCEGGSRLSVVRTRYGFLSWLSW